MKIFAISENQQSFFILHFSFFIKKRLPEGNLFYVIS